MRDDIACTKCVCVGKYVCALNLCVKSDRGRENTNIWWETEQISRMPRIWLQCIWTEKPHLQVFSVYSRDTLWEGRIMQTDISRKTNKQTPIHLTTMRWWLLAHCCIFLLFLFFSRNITLGFGILLHIYLHAKNCEGWYFPYWHANRLTCLGFMDAGRWLETFGSEKRNWSLKVHTAASTYLCQFSLP